MHEITKTRVGLEKELTEAEKDLAESKKVLRIAKNKAKGAKGGKLERKQAKRVLKSMKDGVDLVKGALRQFAEAGGGKRTRCAER
jgi:hypothetical protein